MSHNPVFTFEVAIGDRTALGSGNSKKQAKHAAARKHNNSKKPTNASMISTSIIGNMLDKLDGREPSNPPPPPPGLDLPQQSSNGGPTSTGSPNGSSTNGGGSGSGGATNPIGGLQEYCVKYSLPLPIYDLQNTR